MHLECRYKDEPPKALSEMKAKLSSNEAELFSLTDTMLKKFYAMTDEDYEKLELYPNWGKQKDADTEQTTTLDPIGIFAIAPMALPSLAPAAITQGSNMFSMLPVSAAGIIPIALIYMSTDSSRMFP